MFFTKLLSSTTDKLITKIYDPLNLFCNRSSYYAEPLSPFEFEKLMSGFRFTALKSATQWEYPEYRSTTIPLSDLWDRTRTGRHLKAPGFRLLHPHLVHSKLFVGGYYQDPRSYRQWIIRQRSVPVTRVVSWYRGGYQYLVTLYKSYPGFSELWSILSPQLYWTLRTFQHSLGDGALYLRGLAVLFFFDAMLTDDEPLWEPVEWSLVQSWILFIFAFAWIAENLITSRYGSYTGRDKRVWVAWYKTFWLIEAWYMMSLGAAALFVIVPFYHEISYSLPLVVSWWNWYSRVFFFKFVSIYSLALYVAYYLQLNLGVFHWRKSLLLILLINLFLSYLLYTQFMISFCAYFTDPNWYHKTKLVDYVQLSHEPNKWSWGNSKRDHFSYHRSTTVFWFKNDGPFAAASLLFNILFFITLFNLYLYWVVLFRRVYTTQEITYTYTTYCVSSLRQFFYYLAFLYLLVLFSFVVQYWRLPIEYSWVSNSGTISMRLYSVILSYPSFLLYVITG